MTLFDTIKHINEYGQEVWYARQLAKVLGYADFGNFENVIKKAKITCSSSGQSIEDHFGDITEEVKAGSGAVGKYPSYQLSRYACYLVAMESDGSKETVGNAKKYFAIQTRLQEINEYSLEDQKRIYLREQVAEHNKSLAKTAKASGVFNFANFVDYGYLGLYGMRNKDILKTKGLDSKASLMDNVGSEELASNLFRATQAEAKIQRESIRGQEKAQQAHLEIGNEVRATIKKVGGTMPEDLPATDHIKEAKRRIKGSQGTFENPQKTVLRKE